MQNHKNKKGFRLFMIAMFLLLALGVWALVAGIQAQNSTIAPPSQHAIHSGEAIGVVR